MASKKIILVSGVALFLLVCSFGFLFLWKRSKATPFLLASVTRRELKMVVSTNGTIEPVDRVEIYAPIDAFVTGLEVREGSEVIKGQLLMRLESKQILTTLAEARAALLQARRQAQTVLEGPPREELAALDASVAEAELRLGVQRVDLRREEALLEKEATTRAFVESLKDQVRLLELQLESLQQKKRNLLNRYSAEEKQWENSRVGELTRQVTLLEQQSLQGAIHSPRSGVLYSLAVNSGSYVNRGQLLAQIYEPGKVFLKAYVDEPDLGRIEKGLQTLIEWDGLPDRQWLGMVERPAKQVIALGNRSIGYVICSVEGKPIELIPNINVKVQIVIARKAAALAVPRTAVFNHNGKSTVMLYEGKEISLKAVTIGMITPQEIEIMEGIKEGNKVIVDASEAAIQ